MTGTTPRATCVVLLSARPTLSYCHTRNVRNPLTEFCKGLKIGKNIIIWVSNEEKEDNQDVNYFVAKIEVRELKLEGDGTYSAVPFRKNEWIVSVCWYDFSPSQRNEREDRFYIKGFSQWIPCGSTIRSITLPVIFDWAGKHYRLSVEY